MKIKAGYDALMHDVCARMGWCGVVVDGKPLHVNDFIPNSGLVTADQFVDWLFRAEGMDPNSKPEQWRRHKEALKAAFIKHMGSDIVDAKALRWSA